MLFSIAFWCHERILTRPHSKFGHTHNARGAAAAGGASVERSILDSLCIRDSCVLAPALDHLHSAQATRVD